MNNLVIKNLQFSSDAKPILKDLNFSLKEGKSLSIIGCGGSGKTTLLKVLDGQLDFSGEVFINGKKVSKNSIKKDIVVVYSVDNFLCENVVDEIKYYLERESLEFDEIKRRILDVTKYFDLSEIINKKVCELSLKEKTLIQILKYILVHPMFIAFDDILVNLDSKNKLLLFNYLNSNNINLINVTSDLEDVIYTDYILCLYDGTSAIDGRTLDVLENEKLLKRLGLSLPFIVDLSIQLKLYDLIDKIYLNKEMMVKDLWK